MNIKLLIIGALAYTVFMKKKEEGQPPLSPAVKPPTQEEIVAAANKTAKEALEQAQSILSSI